MALRHVAEERAPHHVSQKVVIFPAPFAEHNFLLIPLIETPRAKRRIHKPLHYERKKWHSKVPVGNL
jgi:hypothetical protein